MVNGAFARAFGSEVQPVELASAIKREADDNAAVVGRNRTIAPNDYVVELGPADHRRLAQWEEALGDELSAVSRPRAAAALRLRRPGAGRFERAEELDTGVFRVRSRTAPDTATSSAGSPRATTGRHSRGRRPRPVRGRRIPRRRADPARAPASAAPYAPPYAAAYPSPDAAAPTSRRRPYPAPPAPASPYAYPAPVDRPPGAGARRPADPADAGGDRAGPRGGRRRPLDDAGVSRRHAEIHVTDDRYRVVDLGSTNGTFVDGERVTAGELRDGSTITVGRSRLVFRLGQR